MTSSVFNLFEKFHSPVTLGIPCKRGTGKATIIPRLVPTSSNPWHTRRLVTETRCCPVELASTLLLNSQDLCLDQSNFRKTQSAGPSQFSKALITRANIFLDYGITLCIHDNLNIIELLKHSAPNLWTTVSKDRRRLSLQTCFYE